MVSKIFVVLSVLVLVVAPVRGQKSRKDIPRAPLPGAIMSAKRIFIVNAGGKDPALKIDDSAELVYDVVYNEIKEWGRYELVESAEQSDLIFVVSYGAENQRTAQRSVYNAYTGQSQVVTDDLSDPTLRLIIVDPKSQSEVWQTTQLREKARRQKNREKNLIEAGRLLVSTLRERVEVKAQ